MTDVSLTPFAPPAGLDLAGMASFTKYNAPLCIEYDPHASTALGYDVWRVTEAFAFYIGTPQDDTWVYIPAGYITDGATVPRFLWDLIPPWGPYGQAAVVHDMLCEYLTVYKKGQPVIITRAHADNILRDALDALQVPRVTKWLIYAGVKLYSYFAHDKKPEAYALKRELENNWRPAKSPT